MTLSTRRVSLSLGGGSTTFGVGTKVLTLEGVNAEAVVLMLAKGCLLLGMNVPPVVDIGAPVGLNSLDVIVQLLLGLTKLFVG